MRFFTFLKYLLIVGTAVMMALALSVWLTPKAQESHASRYENVSARFYGELGHTPYMKAHRQDLIAWMPWGEAAFERARKENKPVFLSGGFAGCQWDGAMQRESFRNPKIAQLINRYFIPVKIDRDEHPEVDRFYLDFVQATTGKAGWPLTVVLTPSGYPFFGGSYFPPTDTFNRVGLQTVLRDLCQRWSQHQELIERSAKEMFELLIARNDLPEQKMPEPAQAMDYLTLTAALYAFDAQAGGFSPLPNYPQYPLLKFLLDYAADWENTPNGQQARDIAIFTLDQVARSALQDQLGGGFFPYSADRFRRRPRFVKDLITQAQMGQLYLEAWRQTQDPYFKAVAQKTLAFTQRELSAENGLFYSGQTDLSFDDTAITAESRYLWETQQIEELLSVEQARVFAYHFGIKNTAGPSPLTQNNSIEKTAEKLGIPPESACEAIMASVPILLEARAHRGALPIDRKCQTAENALMISALIKAYRLTKQTPYLERALTAARALQTHLYDKKNRLLKRLCLPGEKAQVPGNLEDYVFTIAAMLDLHEAINDPEENQWLKWAQALQETQDSLFWDRASPGYFNTQAPILSGFPRMKEATDGITPCPNAVSALNLNRLSRLCSDKTCLDRAKKLLANLAPQITQQPLAHATWATILRKNAAIEQKGD